MEKICLVLPGLQAGGIENYVLRYLIHLKDIHHIVILSRSSLNGDLLNEYQKTGVKLKHLPFDYINIFNWIDIYNYFKEENFYTVCDFGGNFAGITLLVAKLAGVNKRIVFYRRSSDAFKPTLPNKLYNYFVHRLVLRYATRILSNSAYALQFFFGPTSSSDPRFQVINNGVDKSSFTGTIDKSTARALFKLPNDTFIVGHVGRYDSSKNHETIFKVAATLYKKQIDVVFVFAGKGTDSTYFKAKLREYGIEQVCIGLGLVSSVPILYKSMDLFYFPSVTEGQPNALIEAMLSGVPILTSDIPPIKEMLEDTNSHLMINALSVSEAVTTIESVFNNPEKLRGMIVSPIDLEKYDATTNFNLFSNELI